MTFLEVEGEKLINLDLIDEVELKHAHQVASLWCGGTVRIADSRIAYTYLMQNQDMRVKHGSALCPRCKAECNTIRDARDHKCPVLVAPTEG